jgi:outer membrane lipoprotein-sorting protein
LAPLAAREVNHPTSPALSTGPNQNADEARQMFEAVERKLAGARGLKVQFESEMTTQMGQGRTKGTVMLAPGNRMKVTLAFVDPRNPGGQAQPAMEYVSDGKTFTMRTGTDPRPGKVEPVKEQHQDTLAGWGTRVGLLMAAMGHLNHGRDDDYRKLGLSELRLLDKEAVGDRQVAVIELTVTKNGVATRHKLWLDAATGLPVKLVVRTRGGFGVVETYSGWEIDPDLPEATFALPEEGKTVPPGLAR